MMGKKHAVTSIPRCSQNYRTHREVAPEHCHTKGGYLEVFKIRTGENSGSIQSNSAIATVRETEAQSGEEICLNSYVGNV